MLTSEGLGKCLPGIKNIEEGAEVGKVITT